MTDELFSTHVTLISQHAALCAAWKAFLCPSTTSLLAPLCNNVWMSHGGWDCLGVSCGATDERIMRRVIESLLLPGFVFNQTFTRADIFQREAWAYVPLRHFVSHDVDAQVRFGINQPMAFSPNCFKLEHRIFRGVRRAKLFCVDYRLGEWSGRKRGVAEHDFDRDATRQVMFDWLLAAVEKRGPECLFTITQDSFEAAVIQANARNGSGKAAQEVLELR